MAWGLVFVAALVICVLVVPSVFYILITWIAGGVTTLVVGLVGTRGLGLLLGVPMLLFGAWGLLRIIQGKSAPNMTPRQLLIGAVSMVLIGALGAGMLIYAIAGNSAPNPSGF